uniref:Expressed protein n=1 Tax=Schizophyllum commune (strain H4-8 / FGSC 9210) TaxID=578458 RepID=D8Q7T5_SCHCM
MLVLFPLSYPETIFYPGLTPLLHLTPASFTCRLLASLDACASPPALAPSPCLLLGQRLFMTFDSAPRVHHLCSSSYYVQRFVTCSLFATHLMYPYSILACAPSGRPQ